MERWGIYRNQIVMKTFKHRDLHINPSTNLLEFFFDLYGSSFKNLQGVAVLHLSDL